MSRKSLGAAVYHLKGHLKILSKSGRAFSSNFGKRPLAKIGNIINLTSKLGEINDIDHNKGSKIYPENQVILDCNYAKHTT